MEENQRLPFAVVGASARAAAFSVVRAGSVPLAADLFADADLVECAEAVRVERYPHGLFDWLRATPPDTFWMYTGALENHPDLIDEMAAIRRIVGCGGDVLRRVRDPLQLAKLFAQADVAFPETMDLRTPLPLDGGGAGGGGAGTTVDLAATNDTSSWLLKTYHGSSGSGVRPWDGRRPHRFGRPARTATTHRRHVRLSRLRRRGRTGHSPGRHAPACRRAVDARGRVSVRRLDRPLASG